MQRVSDQLAGLLEHTREGYLATIFKSRTPPGQTWRVEGHHPELGTIISVEETLPGFLYFAGKLGYSALPSDILHGESVVDWYSRFLGATRGIIALRGGRAYISSTDDAEIMRHTIALRLNFEQIRIDISKDLEEWRGMCDRHHYVGPISTGLHNLPRGLRLEISRRTGLPSVCMRHILDIYPDFPTLESALPTSAESLFDRTSKKKITTAIEGKRVVLLRAYEAIVEHAPYDLEEQNLLVGLINAAHDHSLSTLNLERLKVDYDLVILPGYREFRRIQESPEIDYDREALPRYWFDPVDLRVDGGAAEAMNVLAIERSWAEDPTSTTRYLLTCGFPAGSMFLRTKIEAQATTPGGGIEYIYLQRPDDKRRVVTLDSRKVCLASEPR